MLHRFSNFLYLQEKILEDVLPYCLQDFHWIHVWALSQWEELLYNRNQALLKWLFVRNHWWDWYHNFPTELSSSRRIIEDLDLLWKFHELGPLSVYSTRKLLSLGQGIYLKAILHQNSDQQAWIHQHSAFFTKFVVLKVKFYKKSWPSLIPFGSIFGQRSLTHLGIWYLHLNKSPSVLKHLAHALWKEADLYNRM